MVEYNKVSVKPSNSLLNKQEIAVKTDEGQH